MAIETIKEIISIPKGATKSIKVSVVSSGKEVFLDIRQWVDTDKYKGPDGKKGVWLHWDAVNRIIVDKVLEKAVDIMDEVKV